MYFYDLVKSTTEENQPNTKQLASYTIEFQMRALITTLGSRGDVQPFVALAKGMISRGYTVALCTVPRFENFITSHGIPFMELRPEIFEFIDSQDGKDAIDGGCFTKMKATAKLYNKVGKLFSMLVEDCWTAVCQFEPNVIIYHPKTGCSHVFAEYLGIPSVLGLPFPMLVPTVEFPNILLPSFSLGSWYNKGTWTAAIAGSKHQLKSYMKDWCAAHDYYNVEVMYNADGEFANVVHMCSAHLIEVPSDWPESVITPGFMFLDTEVKEDDIDPDLVAFLEGDVPVVYFGFGSMMSKDPETKANAIIEAVKQCNVKAVLASGWGGLGSDNVPDNVFLIEAVPHDWLFPRVSIVVHHGGAGTTAAGLRAGKPTIICPFIVDQFYWAKRIEMLHVGCSISKSNFTADKICETLMTILNDGDYVTNAEALGNLIRNEFGIEDAVDFIDSLL